MFNQLSISICLTLLLALSIPAQAQDDKSITDKIKFIQSALNEESTHSFIWQNGWTTIYGISTAMELVGWRKEPVGSAKKYDHGVSLITSTMALAGMFMEPLDTHNYAKQLAEMPEQTRDEKAYKLKMAEMYLQQSADRERLERSWEPQISSLIVSALAGAAIAFDDNRKKDGLIAFASSMIWTEIKVFTTPNNLNDSLAQYRSNLISKRYQNQRYWQLSGRGTSLNLSYHF